MNTAQLTNTFEWDYSDLTTAKSVVGLDLLFTSALALFRSAIFTPKVYGGLCRALRRAAPRSGRSTCIAHHPCLISMVVILKNLYEDTAMPNLSILSKEIRQLDELYSLNDLHKAAGSNSTQKPSNWLRNQQVIDLIELLKSEQLTPIIKKQGLGTFACRELVYAYAMWISPKFHLTVIRAFDQQQHHTLPAHLIEQRFLAIIKDSRITSMKPLSADVFICDTSKVSEVVDLVRWFAPTESLTQILKAVANRLVEKEAKQ